MNQEAEWVNETVRVSRGARESRPLEIDGQSVHCLDVPI